MDSTSIPQVPTFLVQRRMDRPERYDLEQCNVLGKPFRGCEKHKHTVKSQRGAQDKSNKVLKGNGMT